MPIFLGTSRRNDMRPLSCQGIFATDCYGQLRSLLARREKDLAALGMPGAAFFLAEPVHDRRSGAIDWYAEGGQAVRLDALSGEERARVMAGVARCARALSDFADAEDARAAGGSSRLLSMGMLRCAMQVPDLETSVYAVDGRPVLVNWGFGPGSASSAPEDILRLGRAVRRAAAPAVSAAAGVSPQAPPPSPAPAAPTAPAAGGSRFPAWLLPLLLLLLLLWLLLAALGVLPSPLPAGCMRQDVDPAAELARRQDLEREYGGLAAALADRARECRGPAAGSDAAVTAVPDGVRADVPVDVPAAEVPAETEPESQIPFFGEDPALPDASAQEGQARTEEEQVPFFGEDAARQDGQQEQAGAEPRSADVPYFGDQPQEKGEDRGLSIPADAQAGSGMDFLEGCWSTASGLVESATGTPVIVEYCFGRNGEGRRILRERSSGAVCEGRARATMRDGGVDIDADPAYCKGASLDEYVPQHIECRGRGDSTRCRSRERVDDGRVVDWDADFQRRDAQQ